MTRPRDLKRAREDLAAFARAIGSDLTRWQAGSLKLDARTTYVLGPRQSGKSRSVAVLAAHRAFREPDHHVLIVSASELGAKRLLAVVAELVVTSPVLSASVVDEQSSLIRLSNRSTIRSVPASSKAIRGWSIDTLIFDEATELGDEIIDLAMPVTAARPDARIVFLSTAGAPVGRAYETYMAGLDARSALVRSHVWRLKDAKWISKAAIEHARLVMPPWRFAAEYEGQWAGAVDALFPPDLLQRASADLDLPSLADLRGPARLLGGCDWGSTHDRSAVAVIARLPTGGQRRDPLFACWIVRHFPVGADLNASAREIAWAHAVWSVLSYETNGLGMGPSQLLQAELLRRRDGEERSLRAAGAEPDYYFDGPALRHNPTNTTWQRKADALGRMRTLAERGQLLFARGGDHGGEFMKQLASVRVEHRQASVGIEAPAGGFDDLVDAAYIASGSYTPHGSSTLRNVLADTALRSDLPEAELPPEAADAETVTVAGVELARQPWLQSVTGPELTAPLGSAAASKPGVHPAIEEAQRAVAQRLRGAGWNPHTTRRRLNA